MNNYYKIISLHGPPHPSSMGGIFSKKKLFLGDKLFWAKTFMGWFFEMGGLMIRSCQGRGGVSK